jgi:glycosyltransferase involved in cell wall biosynthesis
MELHVAGHSALSPSRMRNTMGQIPPVRPDPSARRGARVLHVIPTALGRGAQVFARALVDELSGTAGGHTLVSLFDGENGVRVDRSLALPGGPEAASGLHPSALARLARVLRDLNPDLVLAHGGDAFKYVALTTGAPIAYCVIGTWPEAARRSPQSLLWRTLIRRAWVCAAVSDDVGADLHDVLAVSRERIVVIPNGRDAEHYQPAPRASEADGVSLLFVGAFTEGKRPDRFIQLVRRLRHDGLPISATMVGDGPLRSALDADAKTAGIEVTGFQKDVVPFLQRADVFVFPSAPDGEGMPGVLIEAGLCGLPVVATRVAGAPTVLEDGRTGLLVGIDDADALARAVSELVRDSVRRRDMGKAARDRCTANFALPVVADRWDTLLTLMASARDMRLPRSAVLEPMRVA